MLDRPMSPADEGRQARVCMQQAEQLVMQHCPESARYFLSELIRLALRLNLPIRRVLREIGACLKAQGLIDAEMDICFASIDILAEAKAKADAGLLPRLGAGIGAEKAAYEAALARSPRHDLSRDRTSVSTVDGVLHGIPGVVRGLICHVCSTADFAGFEQGAILVARTTNPAWTPLFFRASAIVTESGGLLSHGAVTARELGLPAVMAITDALNLLPNGALAEVDGQGRERADHRGNSGACAAGRLDTACSVMMTRIDRV